MVVSLRARVSGVKDTEVERWDQRTWCNFTIPRFQAEGNAGRRRICHSGHQMFQEAKFNMFVCISPNLIVIVVHAARSIYLYIYIHYMICCYMCVFPLALQPVPFSRIVTRSSTSLFPKETDSMGSCRWPSKPGPRWLSNSQRMG